MELGSGTGARSSAAKGAGRTSTRSTLHGSTHRLRSGKLQSPHQRLSGAESVVSPPAIGTANRSGKEQLHQAVSRFWLCRLELSGCAERTYSSPKYTWKVLRPDQLSYVHRSSKPFLSNVEDALRSIGSGCCCDWSRSCCACRGTTQVLAADHQPLNGAAAAGLAMGRVLLGPGRLPDRLRVAGRSRLAVADLRA